MSKRGRRVLVVIAGVFALGVGFVAYALYRINEVGVKSLSTMSHAAQLHHALSRYFNDHPDWVGAQPSTRPGGLIALDSEAKRRLMIDASAHYDSDPAVPGDVTVDAWRRPLRFEVSLDASGRVVHSITSFGPDGVEGTVDDITFSSDYSATPTTHPS